MHLHAKVPLLGSWPMDIPAHLSIVLQDMNAGQQHFAYHLASSACLPKLTLGRLAHTAAG